MANDVPATRVESVAFDDLVPIASRLNTASDDLNEALKRIQDRLNELSLGIARFVPIPSTHETLSDGTERHDEESYEYQVGYDRLGDGWALVTRRAHFTDDATDTLSPEDCWQFDEQKALLRSSRELRIAAVAAIPELLKELKGQAQSVLEVVETARRLAGDSNQDSGCDVIREHSRYARLAVHAGTASLVADGDAVTGPAEFLLPAEGAPIVAFRSSQPVTNNFGKDLRLVGLHDGRPFTLVSPVCYTRKPASGRSEGWSLVSPINEPVKIDYSGAGPAKTARVLLNNFDYDCGDPSFSETGVTRIGTPMVIRLTDRQATFNRRADYSSVYSLVRSGLLRSASLTECSFDVLDDSDDDLLALANDVASLLTVAHGASVGVAMVEILDEDNRPARRIVTQPVRSRYRDDAIVDDFNVPRLFEESFEPHVRMRRSRFPWQKLASYCGSLDDMPYIEQKFAALIMAIEFFMRVSLVESGADEERVTKLDLNKLIGETRKRLGWDIPKHYTVRDTLRLLRNAVMHGSEAPVRDSAEFRLLFNKWRLFLFRRILIRLGYQGDVVSPHKGWSGSSVVSDFSAAHNSFDTNEADSHPVAQFVQHLRQHSNAQLAHEATPPQTDLRSPDYRP